MPSLASETFGLAAAEALAAGLPVAASDIGALPELLPADWLTPHLYNVRFVERPTLQSWIIEAISAPFGDVNQIAARLPSVLFLLFGCVLIYVLLRRVAAR